MPELAEVEFFRRRWARHEGAVVRAVHAVPGRIFRGSAPGLAAGDLVGRPVGPSRVHGKRMLFRFGEDRWLEVHLGLDGALRAGAADEPPRDRHDHLVLVTDAATLRFRDTRHFGRLVLSAGARAPADWDALPPDLFDPSRDAEWLAGVLARHRRAPLKAILLRQEHFPGIGNWMADEILWRAGLAPARAGGEVDARRLRRLHSALHAVVQDAWDHVAGDPANPPAELNDHVPPHWLFNHRWTDGGRCPRTGRPLRRETIAGRTTCWCPSTQR